MPFLMQGVFFQHHIPFLFGGVVFFSLSRELGGYTKDQFGNAEIDRISLDDRTFSFRKKYERRTDFIEYVFQKQPDGSWRGVYRGGEVGEGETHCVITEVPEDFFTEGG